jgi:RNA recognition motif-containing protein
MNIYMGKIICTVIEQDLRDAFVAFGEVSSAAIIKDKFSGENRGFGFVVTLDDEGRGPRA